MEKKKNSGCFNVFIGIIIIAIFISLLTSDSKDSESQIPDETEAYIIAKDYVKQELKAPATAQFSTYTCQQETDSTYYLNGYVDAENSFGALLRSTWTVKLKWLGGDWAHPTNWDLIDIDVR